MGLRRCARGRSFLGALVGAVIFMGAAVGSDWLQIKGDHFIILFTQDKKFASEVLDRAELYYRRIAADLGYARASEFWTWDKRVKIYIHPDHASYIGATAQPDWSYGMADYTKKEIRSFAWSQGFLDSLLPHEMAHLIFRDFVGFKGEVPLWLDEGVAQWAEEPKRLEMKRMVKRAFIKNGLLSIDDMMKLDIRKIREKDKLYIRPMETKKGDKGVLFLSGDSLVSMYYLQSVSLVGFLIEKYGSEDFAHFCRQLRDGKDFASALQSVYAAVLPTQDVFRTRWMEYIEE